jgi:carboxylesterase
MTEVIQGAEAWSHYPDGTADVGVLVLHGLTGSPVSMRPLAERLAEEGFAVEMPLLPGHGTHWRDLQRTTWHAWAGEASAALDRLRDRTRIRIVTGLSMGGTLALHLAVTRGRDLAGIAVINPSLAIADPRMKALPLLKWVVPGLPGIGNDIAKPGGDEQPYPRLPLRALASLVQLQRVVRQSLHRVTVPTLVLTSRQDHVVEPENSTTVLDGISSADREQVWLERSYHVATLDHDADLIVERVTGFARRLAASVAPEIPPAG